jgi:hypothetical protein
MCDILDLRFSQLVFNVKLRLSSASRIGRLTPKIINCLISFAHL